MKRVMMVVGLLMLVVGLVGCTEAQRTSGENSALGLNSTDQGSLSLGSASSATLDTLTEAHDWTFSGEQGQVVTIRVEAADGADTDPRVNLLSPAGEFLTSADDSDGYNAVISAYELPETGDYTVKVDVFEPGEYTVLVTAE
jgi:hypothetical protein